MKIVVWTLSILLAVAFFLVGGMKLLAPAAEMQQASGGIPVALSKIAGTAEVLGALGLVLPAATRIMPTLTPLAAAGLTLTMVGAIVTNVIVGVYSAVPTTVILGLIAGFVCWARFDRYAVPPRGGIMAPAATA